MPQLTIDQAIQFAVQHHQAGRLGEAEGIYRQVLSQQPDHPEALHLLGVIAMMVGRYDAAVELIQRAVQIRPDFAEACSNLGNAFWNLGRVDEAVAACRESIRINPRFADAFSNLGNALNARGQFEEAAAACFRALALKPDCYQAHSNLGNAYTLQGKLDEAEAAYQRAIQLQPGASETIFNLGITLFEQGRLDEALACYRRAVFLDPDNASYLSAPLHGILYHPGYEAAAIHALHRDWNKHHAVALKQLLIEPPDDSDSDRRIRIGYISADFRDHVVGRNMLPLLREHDRKNFEVICYAQVWRPDELTAQFRSIADGWRNIMGSSDQQVAELVRADRIDILVDLTLHMARSRLLVFARKPAPVQVTFAGYPGTTGLDAMDYRLTDPFLDPPGQTEEFYSEESLRLPDSFWCYDPKVMTSGTAQESLPAPLPALASGRITFGCLNNFCKVNDQVLALWAGVLKKVDDSRLMLMAPQGSARRRTTDFLDRKGIDSARIEFVSIAPIDQYLHRYDHIDIGLDTFPYNGHTTSLDALWMGVPVVTLVGRTVVGRAGLSQLMNLNLPELIATSGEQYIRIATNLAYNLPRLRAMRAGLRDRMRRSPLTDVPRFARNVESAYRQMWRARCAAHGQPVQDE